MAICQKEADDGVVETLSDAAGATQLDVALSTRSRGLL